MQMADGLSTMMKIHQSGKENIDQKSIIGSEEDMKLTTSTDNFEDLTNESKTHKPIETIIKSHSVVSDNYNSKSNLTSFWEIHSA